MPKKGEKELEEQRILRGEKKIEFFIEAVEPRSGTGPKRKVQAQAQRILRGAV